MSFLTSTKEVGVANGTDAQASAELMASAQEGVKSMASPDVHGSSALDGALSGKPVTPAAQRCRALGSVGNPSADSSSESESGLSGAGRFRIQPAATSAVAESGTESDEGMLRSWMSTLGPCTCTTPGKTKDSRLPVPDIACRIAAQCSPARSDSILGGWPQAHGGTTPFRWGPSSSSALVCVSIPPLSLVHEGLFWSDGPGAVLASVGEVAGSSPCVRLMSGGVMGANGTASSPWSSENMR
mmetsp:Transcript_16816/g.50920  ORF Transcript_16816/g.50920 Transcript_16816/m.50920 type:complete len:242 (+) Transcript_16816:435-1160(+)